MQDILKYVNKLVMISDGIIKEIEILSFLSYNGREDTDQFMEHVLDVRNYLRQESIILNNVSLDVLNKIYDYLITHDDMSDGYARTILAVLDKMDETAVNEDDDISTAHDMEDETDDIINSFDILSEYMNDEDDEAIKYKDDVTNYMATLAIKKMLPRIKSVYTDNKMDKKYKDRLTKYFNYFKYYYFTMDTKLERLGANCNFNVDMVPFIPFQIENVMDIFNNECVGIISDMYDVKNNEYDIEKISRALFQTLIFEEYVKGINDDTVNKLLDLCYRLDEIHKNSFYGNIIKDKLLIKKKN